MKHEHEAGAESHQREAMARRVLHRMCSMTMTKAQLEAWLEGWRLVEAVQRAAEGPFLRQRALVQMFEISDFARAISTQHHFVEDPLSRLTDPWIRLRTLIPHD